MEKYTDKVGYRVRFGGPKGIQWIKEGSSQAPRMGLNLGAAVEPIALVIEATKAAAMLLQWWEIRKQTLLQAAEFEERRIPWLTEMIFQWSSELSDGRIRLDTAAYFDREVSRLLERIIETKLMDIPSAVLLQVERTAQCMVSVNRFLAIELQKEQGNFIVPDRELPRLLEYQPYWELEGQDSKMRSYLEKIDRTLKASGDAISLIGCGIAGVATWRFSVWQAARAAAKQKERVDEFKALTGVALELRSLRAQLAFCSLLPQSEQFIPLEADLGAIKKITSPRASSTPRKSKLH